MKKTTKKNTTTDRKQILHDYFQTIGSKGGTAAKGRHTMTSERARQTVSVRIAKYGQKRHKTVATADAPAGGVSE